jgi:acetyl esterase/lipase
MTRLRLAVRILSVAAISLLSACSSIDYVNVRAEKDHILATRDVAYGEGLRRKIDVYRPEGVARAPTVVFFYGGGWTNGDRRDYEFTGAALASKGILAMVPDYRVYPEVGFPGFLEDAAAAAAWAKRHAAEYGGDPDRIYLMGHSAGAYIAVMLSLDPQWLQTAGMDPRKDIAGTIGMAGPYDFLPLRSDTLKKIFGPEASWDKTQPINFVAKGSPPLLLFHGGLDLTVWQRNSENLAAKVKAVGGDVTLITYPWLGHIFLMGSISQPFRFFAPTLDEIVKFVDQTEPASAPRTAELQRQ